MDPGSHVGFQISTKNKSGRGPSSEHFWQVWLKSVQRFQRRRFKCEKLTDERTTDAYPWQKLTWPMARWAKNQPTRNKNYLWRPCLLMDWDEMSKLYRGPSIDASYQVSDHLSEGFQRHISVIQFRYLYRDNCILNTDIYIWTRAIFLLTEEKIF